jgi:hypothetical protein
MPALSLDDIELISPYKNGDGKYPNVFFTISPLEFPKALIYGATDDIILPVNPGTIAPPKNKTNQSKEEQT